MYKRQGSYNAADLTQWHHPARPDQLVTWVESHDTYCNQHESAHLTDDQIRAGFVFLTARQHGRPLFYSRPAGSTRENYWGNNILGARGNDEFKHPEVVAANAFRRAMHGRVEHIFTSPDGAVVQVARGEQGAAVINLSGRKQSVRLDTTLPDGTYTDTVHHVPFTVRNGILRATIEPHASYILYAPRM